jgi:hypothetical protein
MLEPRYFVTTNGSNVFVESRGDYIAQDGTAYNNVYIFRFARHQFVTKTVLFQRSPRNLKKKANWGMSIMG